MLYYFDVIKEHIPYYIIAMVNNKYMYLISPSCAVVSSLPEILKLFQDMLCQGERTTKFYLVRTSVLTLGQPKTIQRFVRKNLHKERQKH